MNVSYDPIVGNEQPTKSYYQRIADDFHNNKDFESNRSTKSLELRIAAIIKDCMKFQSFYEEIERRHPSGVTYQEHLSEAQARYAKASKGKTCQFIHCWLKVRHSEKFATARINVGSSRPAAKTRDINLNVPAGSQCGSQAEPQCGSQAADDEGQEVGQEKSKTARPPGRKQSKEKLKSREGEDQYMGLMKNFLEMKAQEHAMKKEIWANEMRADEQAKKTKELEESRKLQLEERKLEIEHQRLMWDQEREVMFCDVTKIDEHQRAYVMAKRAELAKAACANVGESTSVGESFVRLE
ncbi:unnamed protein product [Urochloa decumbens]|uniref:No apical meristem-associated C-terminal domain-containing protein n=1 Tax=Urochloa decumbens TaxID=240449 RepID=A0ABC9C3K4_9POAL